MKTEKSRGFITLRNDFHGTTARIIVRDGYLSARQLQRAGKKLCGVADCKCSAEDGTRGPQDVKLDFDYDLSYDSHHQLLGAYVYQREEG